MVNRENVRALHTDRPAPADGAHAAGKYSTGPYKDAAKAFFRQRVGEATYERAMNSEAGRRHHYVAARAFLGQADWEKFVWIEQYGSLENYPD